MENNEEELEIITTEEDMDKNDTENSNKEESREFYVYKHIRKDNNTCFYVGKGKGRRMYVQKRNKHFNRIRKKYGCYVIKIKENLTEKEAFALEREIIEDYVFVFGYGINIDGYRDCDHEYLTNCTWGGEGVSGMNPWNKGKKGIQAGERHPMYGKHHSEESRKKNSESHKGKKHSKEAKRKMSENNSGAKNPMAKKVICITTGETFDCIKDASDNYNVAKSSICGCCQGKRKHAGKLDGVLLQWKYAEDDDNESKAV